MPIPEIIDFTFNTECQAQFTVFGKTKAVVEPTRLVEALNKNPPSEEKKN